MPKKVLALSVRPSPPPLLFFVLSRSYPKTFPLSLYLTIIAELSKLNRSFWRLSGNDLYRGENPDRCRGLGIISKLQMFSTRVQRPSRERPEALTQEESGFSYGQRTLTTSVLLVWEEPSKRSRLESRLGGLWRWGTGKLCCINTLISAFWSRVSRQ